MRLVRVPTLVMLVWAPVMRDPVRAVRFEIPVTLRLVSVPVLVILG